MAEVRVDDKLSTPVSNMDTVPTTRHSATGEDPFETVLLLEERLNFQGYEDGFIDGCKKGLLDGFAAGHREGATIGSKIGFYLTFSESWLSFLMLKTSTDEKAFRSLKSFHQKLAKFQIIDLALYSCEVGQIETAFKKVLDVLQLSFDPESYRWRDLSF